MQIHTASQKSTVKQEDPVKKYCRQMLTSFELFGVAFLFIWCWNGVPSPLFQLYTLAPDRFNQLCSNEGKIVPTQVLPHEAE